MIATMVGDSSSGPAPAALMTFLGPDEHSQIRAVNQNNIEVAAFAVCDASESSFTIVRHALAGAAPTTICTGSMSSGSIDMIVRGQSIRFAATTAGLALIYEVLETPMLGTLRWSTSNSRTYHLKGSGGMTVAQADVPALRFTVHIPGDDVTLDCLLAGWIALLQKKAKKKGSSKGVGLALKVIGQLAGGVGGDGG